MRTAFLVGAMLVAGLAVVGTASADVCVSVDDVDVGAGTSGIPIVDLQNLNAGACQETDCIIADTWNAALAAAGYQGTVEC